MWCRGGSLPDNPTVVKLVDSHMIRQRRVQSGDTFILKRVPVG